MKKEANVDVIAVKYADLSVLWVMENKPPHTAESIIEMAVFRQGVEDRFFTTAPMGWYKQGDIFGKKRLAKGKR